MPTRCRPCAQQVRTYKRLSPLVVQGEALGGLGGAAAGDCLVGFSRRSLHGLRREVVRRTGREACLVSARAPGARGAEAEAEAAGLGLSWVNGFSVHGVIGRRGV